MLIVDVVPKPTMHVYAPGEKDAIPVTLSLTPDKSIKAAPPQFPPAEKYHFEALKLTQLVYSKPFRITQRVSVAATARGRANGGTLPISGTLRYQACDDKVCYVPKSVPISWELEIR